MPARRALPLLLAAPALSAARGAAAQGLSGYRWRVTRQGVAIGTHAVAFEEAGGRRIARSEMVVAPAYLGVVVYRWEHRLTEVTEAGRFVSIRSHFNRNGRIVEAEAEVVAEGVRVQGPDGMRLLPAGAAPLSWWEGARMGGAVPLFLTTTVRPAELNWTREGRAGGVTRWRIQGDVEAAVDFDAAGRWVGHAVRGEDGVTVLYEAA